MSCCNSLVILFAIVRLEMRLGIQVVESLSQATFVVRVEARNIILKIVW